VPVADLSTVCRSRSILIVSLALAFGDLSSIWLLLLVMHGTSLLRLVLYDSPSPLCLEYPLVLYNSTRANRPQIDVSRRAGPSLFAEHTYDEGPSHPGMVLTPSQESPQPQLKEASTTPPRMSAVAVQAPSLLPSPRDMMWESRRGPELLSRPRAEPAQTEKVELPSIRQVRCSPRAERIS
jgi:hypothetical protein